MSVAYVPPVPPAPADPLFTAPDLEAMRAWFDARPDLGPTPLRRLPSLARSLGLAALWVKDETRRFGLPAFKGAGAFYAVGALAADGRLEGRELACASEGNHGRAVARAARQAGVPAHVYLAEGVARARADAIAAEGARIVRVPGTYDDAVRQVIVDAEREGWLVVSDTSWEGYEEIPRLIMLGYARLFDEAARVPEADVDVVFVQAGVGGLLAAAASWFAASSPGRRPAVVAVEPAAAACVQAAMRAGRPIQLPGPMNTTMACLRCGLGSPLALRHLAGWVDAYVAIDDEWAHEAMRRLARPATGDRAVEAGASGAAALGGLLATLFDPALAEVKRLLRLGPGTRALAVVTEGVNDPAQFAAVLGRPV
ncbi:MAG: pyridoxal-phosphate dependent enzyme [Acidobacteriota bacterium]